MALIQGGMREPLSAWAGRPIVAFAGLARPSAFFRTLTEAGLKVVGGRNLGLLGSDEYIEVSPEDWLRIGEQETTPDA